MDQDEKGSVVEQNHNSPELSSGAPTTENSTTPEAEAAQPVGQEHTSQVEHKGSGHQAFDPVTGLFIPTFNFILFAVAAYFLFRKTLKKAMVSRRSRYLGLREDTEKLLKEAEGKLAEINKKYQTLDVDMADIVSRAKATGEIEARRIVEEAHATANHIRRETERIVSHELQLAKTELQTEIVKLATETVNKKIKNELTMDVSSKFNEKLVLEISKA